MNKWISLGFFVLFSLMSLGSNAKIEFTISALVGNADQENQFDYDGHSYGVKGSSNSFGIRVGMDVNKHISLEVSYFDYGSLENNERINDVFYYGSSTISMSGDSITSYQDNRGEYQNVTSIYSRQENIEIEAKSFNAGILGRLPLGPSVAIGGRVGMAMWSYDESLKTSYSTRFYQNDNTLFWDNSGVGGGSDSDKGFSPYFGFLVMYYFGDSMSISVEYSYLELDVETFNTDSEQTIENTSLSLGFRF